MNLLEPQWYPERQQYPGGPPETPYDLAGWTLPMQMGVQVDRIEAPFTARTEEIADLASVVAGRVTGSASYGYALSPNSNAAFHAVNRLLANGSQVSTMREAFGSHTAGTFIVRAGSDAADVVRTLARDFGLDFAGLSGAPDVEMEPLRLPRVGLYKGWQSRVDDLGWTLWLMEQYEVPVDTLHDADIRSGDLSSYDAIIFPNQPGDEILLGNSPGTMPDRYIGGLGAQGAQALRAYVEAGGTIIAFDEATTFPIEQFGLPVRNAVAGLPPEQFFIPGSLIRMDVDTENRLSHGMPSEVAAFYSQSRAFEVVRLPREGEGGAEPIPEAAAPAVDVVARYAQDSLLMSGWALGEERHLAGRAALVSVNVGDGHVVLFGFRPQFRGQSRGTYKLLFNAIQRAASRTPRATS